MHSLGLKDLFTLGNAAAGFLLILFSAGFFVPSIALPVDFGLLLLLAAIFFDLLDGFVARSHDASNAFGKELDSLADVVSFGVAPLVFIVSRSSGLLFSFYGFGFAAFLFYLFCVVYRLAAFNTQEERGVYYGLPSPVAALAVVVAQLTMPQFVFLALFAFGLVMVSGFKLKKVF